MAGDRRRWWMLGLGMGAQAASCVFLYGLPYLVPDLRHQLGLSLAAASTLVAAPLIGVIVTLVAWGALADRYGERLVITAGLAIAAAPSSPRPGCPGRWASASCSAARARGEPRSTRPAAGWSWAGSARRNAAWPWGPADRPAARYHARGGRAARHRGALRPGRSARRVRRPVSGRRGPGGHLRDGPAAPVSCGRRRRPAPTVRPHCGASTRPACCSWCRSLPRPASRWSTWRPGAAGARSTRAGSSRSRIWPAR